MSSLAESKKQNEWFEWGKVIIVALIVVFLLRSFGISTSVVEGESMNPTLKDGERLLFNKFVYIVSEPKRGDIIIIQRPEKNYVKRVIGLPNETIDVKDHTLYIDDNKQSESVGDTFDTEVTGNFGPIEIPEDHYFVMGDNRAISKDSRNGLGFIERRNIIGKSEFSIYPFSEWQVTR